MAALKIAPSKLKGELKIPPSKSHTMRALLFGAMGKGRTTIHNYLSSPDTQMMAKALMSMGASITFHKEHLVVEGVDGHLLPCEDIIDAGNSGQVLRFIGSLAALMPSYTILTGDHSIRHNRPVHPLLSALTQLGVFAVSSKLDGTAPIIIRGPFKAGVATLDGADSQPISGLLMACSFLEGKTQLHVTNPGETPWIDLTLSWIKKMGGQIIHEDYKHYTIEGSLRYCGFDTTIAGDMSSLAFPIGAALITDSELTIENVDMQDCQGDKKIIPILEAMGARFKIDENKKSLTVCSGAHLQGITVDGNEMIDAIPLLAVLGCFASGKMQITNAFIARRKESDRLFAITKELRKMGATICEKEDGLIIEQSDLKSAQLSSHADHRIAMSLAVAALGSFGESTLEDAECIKKSYPNFICDFQKMGARICHV